MSPTLKVMVILLAPLVLRPVMMLAALGAADKCGPPDGRGEFGMNDVSTVALSPETVIRQMKQNGVTDIVWLPDSETNWLYLLMQADPDLRLVGVTREGHACSIAAGLAAGGRKPMILIQNTGMLESGDSIRGWLMGLNVPVVLMVGYRGYTRHGVNTDTAATYTERFLMAFNIPFYLVENDADSDRITTAFQQAERTRQPVVVLVGDEYHGFNR
jgi:sulfopyruvate decarboxylase TPP-binding subunit